MKLDLPEEWFERNIPHDNLDVGVGLTSQLVCECCGVLGAERRMQNTAYADDELNWAVYCAECQKCSDEYWKGMWKEYYDGRL